MLMHINETLNEFQFDLQFSRRLGAQCRPAPASASFRAKCKSGCAKLASTDGFLTVSLAHTMQIFWLISMFWLCALGGATVGPDDSSGRELMSTFNCLFPAIFFLFFLFVERELCMDNLCKFIRSCLISDRGVLWMPRRCFKCRHWFCIFISSSSIRLQLFESVSGGKFFFAFSDPAQSIRNLRIRWDNQWWKWTFLGPISAHFGWCSTWRMAHGKFSPMWVPKFCILGPGPIDWKCFNSEN